MADIKCPSCGSPNVEQIDVDKYQCPYCGATFTASVQNQVNNYVGNATNVNPTPPVNIQPSNDAPVKKPKSRVVAAVLALCLGGLGAHHFYLGNYVRGIIYLVLCWTYVPSIVGFVEGIIYLTQSDEVFASKH